MAGVGQLLTGWGWGQSQLAPATPPAPVWTPEAAAARRNEMWGRANIPSPQIQYNAYYYGYGYSPGSWTHRGWDSYRRPIYGDEYGRTYYENGVQSPAPSILASAVQNVAAAVQPSFAQSASAVANAMPQGQWVGSSYFPYAGQATQSAGGWPTQQSSHSCPPAQPWYSSSDGLCHNYFDGTTAPTTSGQGYGFTWTGVSGLPSPTAGGLLSALGAAVGAVAGLRLAPKSGLLSNPIVSVGGGAALGAALAGMLSLSLSNAAANSQYGA